jgi:ferredoxin-NADP reductase/ferredoxin/DMSO/TMAO reductase YedYZ heme-binding membrane subunit
MKIKNVKVIPWCISCRNCENVAPDTFKVAPKSKVISHEYNWKEAEIIIAELLCPVNVIKVEKTWNSLISLKQAKIVKKDYLTSDVIELKLETKNFSAQPWQYVALQMQDWKWTFYRNYSITQFWSDFIVLTIKLLSDGRWGKYLKKLKVWKKLSYIWALWSFTLQNNAKPKVFFVTWTGISPAIAMLEQLDDDIEKKLYFWIRDTSEIFYEEKLKKYKNLEYKIFLSQEDTQNYHYGRVNQEIESVTKDCEVYMCGNPKMTDQVIHELKLQNHPEDQIFSEWFVAWKEERNIFKLIFLQWVIPYINKIEKILLAIWLLIIPSLYFYWVFTNNLYKSNFILWESITSLLFIISWLSVVFVMYIRPLAQLFPKLGILKTLTTQRKSLWIISSIVVFVIFFNKYIFDYWNFLNYFHSNNWNWLYPILSRISELTAIVLLFTSNNYSQKKLGIWWKRIQRSSYLYFISWGLVAAAWWADYYYWSLWIWWILFIAAWIKNKYFNK